MKTLIHRGLIYLGLVAVLFSQILHKSGEQEQYGFQAIYAPRTFDTTQTVMTQGYLNYSYQTGFGTQVLVSIGANDFLIPGPAAGVGAFQSTFTVAYRVGIKQYFGGLFVGGELWYYSAEGNLNTEKPDSVIYTFKNTYSFYEGPIEIGYDLVMDRLALTVGVTTSFLYGKNQKALTARHRGYSMDFGKKTNKFISRLPVGVVTGISIPLSSTYSLQIFSNWYSSKGFTASLSLWAVAK